jgi:hypothetical protein
MFPPWLRMHSCPVRIALISLISLICTEGLRLVDVAAIPDADDHRRICPDLY